MDPVKFTRTDASIGDATLFSQLSAETFVILFQHVDMVTQQRIRRVSKYWKELIALPEVAEKVGMDAASMLQDRRINRAVGIGGDYCRTLTVPGIREITYNGLGSQGRVYNKIEGRLLKTFGYRCPNLTKLTMYNLKIDYAASGLHEQIFFMSWNLTITETIAVIAKTRLPVAWDSSRAVPSADLMDVILTCNVQGLVVHPVGDATVVDRLKEQLVFAHLEVQIDWCIGCAIRLSKDQFWLNWLRTVGLADVAVSIETFNAIFRDGEVQKRRAELRELIPPIKWFVMAAYILARDSPDFPKVPVRFCFETADFYRLVRGPGGVELR